MLSTLLTLVPWLGFCVLVVVVVNTLGAAIGGLLAAIALAWRLHRARTTGGRRVERGEGLR